MLSPQMVKSCYVRYWGPDSSCVMDRSPEMAPPGGNQALGDQGDRVVVGSALKI